jgi:hypothetical protein
MAKLAIERGAKFIRVECPSGEEIDFKAPVTEKKTKTKKPVRKAQSKREKDNQESVRRLAEETATEPSEADLDYAYGVHGGSKVGSPLPPNVRVVVRQTTPVMMIHDSRAKGQYLFEPQGDGTVLVRHARGKHSDRYTLSCEDARALSRKLIADGWYRW